MSVGSDAFDWDEALESEEASSTSALLSELKAHLTQAGTGSLPPPRVRVRLLPPPAERLEALRLAELPAPFSLGSAFDPRSTSLGDTLEAELARGMIHNELRSLDEEAATAQTEAPGGGSGSGPAGVRGSEVRSSEVSSGHGRPTGVRGSEVRSSDASAGRPSEVRSSEASAGRQSEVRTSETGSLPRVAHRKRTPSGVEVRGLSDELQSLEDEGKTAAIRRVRGAPSGGRAASSARSASEVRISEASARAANEVRTSDASAGRASEVRSSDVSSGLGRPASVRAGEVRSSDASAGRASEVRTSEAPSRAASEVRTSEASAGRANEVRISDASARAGSEVRISEASARRGSDPIALTEPGIVHISQPFELGPPSEIRSSEPPSLGLLDGIRRIEPTARGVSSEFHVAEPPSLGSLGDFQGSDPLAVTELADVRISETAGFALADEFHMAEPPSLGLFDFRSSDPLALTEPGEFHMFEPPSLGLSDFRSSDLPVRTEADAISSSLPRRPTPSIPPFPGPASDVPSPASGLPSSASDVPSRRSSSSRIPVVPGHAIDRPASSPDSHVNPLGQAPSVSRAFERPLDGANATRASRIRRPSELPESFSVTSEPPIPTQVRRLQSSRALGEAEPSSLGFGLSLSESRTLLESSDLLTPNPLGPPMLPSFSVTSEPPIPTEVRRLQSSLKRTDSSASGMFQESLPNLSMRSIEAPPFPTPDLPLEALLRSISSLSELPPLSDTKEIPPRQGSGAHDAPAPSRTVAYPSDFEASELFQGVETERLSMDLVDAPRLRAPSETPSARPSTGRGPLPAFRPVTEKKRAASGRDPHRAPLLGKALTPEPPKPAPQAPYPPPRPNSTLAFTVEVTAYWEETPLVCQLSKPGQQYIVGHATPDGGVAPGLSHLGLRLVRIREADGRPELVFPRDALGEIRRRAARARLVSLASEQSYSCMQLEPGDEVDVWLGEGAVATHYLIHVKPAG